MITKDEIVDELMNYVNLAFDLGFFTKEEEEEIRKLYTEISLVYAAEAE